MENVTLNEINRNVLMIKRELDYLKMLIEESELELSDDVIVAIEESRKKDTGKFKTQSEIEDEFL